MPERDRHVTRTGADYADAMSRLLPQGLAWPRHASSVLMQVVRGLTNIWGTFEFKASKLLEQESDPRATVELLDDWERNWALPADAGAPQLCADEPGVRLGKDQTAQREDADN